MSVARRVLLDSSPCLDPWPLGLSDAETCNSVTCPIGFDPGRAYVVVDRATGDALDLNAAHTISFVDDTATVTLSGYYIDRASVVHVDGDLQACRVVELFDKRALLGLSGINQRFNFHKPLPYHLEDTTQVFEKYFSDSLNSTSLHTWATIWEAIWDELPGIAGSMPALPYTPTGTPKNLEYRGSAWNAAYEFLSSIGCTIAFNPVTDAFTVVRLSQAQSGLTAALTTLTAAGKSLFNARDRAGQSATDAPEKWFILSPAQHVQQDDHSEPGNENEISSGVTGPAAGTRAAIWLNYPTTYCEDGGPQNDDSVTDRAEALASELSGKAVNSNGNGHVEFSGAISAITTGSQVAMIRWRDYGDDEGQRTEYHQYTQELDPGHPQDINTDKIIRVKLTEALAPGQSASAVVVAYNFALQDWYADQCTLTVYDSLGYAQNGLPEGFQLWVKWNYDSEVWEILSVPDGIVYFRLYERKLLTSPQPFLAIILVFDGVGWVDSGIFIKVHDFYYNAPGFFTGTPVFDRGWAKMHKAADDPQDPDEYTLIWMSGPAHVVRFTLTASRTGSAPDEAVNATINQYFLYGNDRLQRTTVYFRDGIFPRALSGAKGYALYNDRDDHYEVVQCDQQCLLATAILSADMCGAVANFNTFTASTFFPFSQAPNPLPTQAVNLFNHCGEAGDNIALMWDETLEDWLVIDVEKKEVEVVTQTRVVITDGGATCTTQLFWQPICIEYCEAGEWRDFEYCCCDGLTSSGDTCAADDTEYTTLEFYDKTLDCTCLPQFGTDGGGETWSTASCPGNHTYELDCDAGTGLPVLHVSGLADATLISYIPGVEIRFQLPALGASCGGGGGTAKVLITP